MHLSNEHILREAENGIGEEKSVVDHPSVVLFLAVAHHYGVSLCFDLDVSLSFSFIHSTVIPSVVCYIPLVLSLPVD